MKKNVENEEYIKLPKGLYTRLLRDVYHHIGAPSIPYLEEDIRNFVGEMPPHPYADNFVGGFMSPEMFKKVTEFSSQRKAIADDETKPVDILSLESGLYTGTYFTNTFDINREVTNYAIHVNVTQSHSGMKQFFAWSSGSGIVYVRNIHTSGVTSGSGLWKRLWGSSVLWTGSEKTIGTKIAMKNSLDLFEKFEITLTSDGGDQQIFTIPAITNTVTHTNISNGTDTSVVGSHAIYFNEFGFKKNNELEIEISINKQIIINNKGVNTSTINLNTLNVVSVVGYK